MMRIMSEAGLLDRSAKVDGVDDWRFDVVDVCRHIWRRDGSMGCGRSLCTHAACVERVLPTLRTGKINLSSGRVCRGRRALADCWLRTGGVGFSADVGRGIGDRRCRTCFDGLT